MLAQLLAVTIMQPGLAQTAASKRTPVIFTCQCSGNILSEKLATKVRDALALSPRYEEVSIGSKSSDGKSLSYHWAIKIVAILDDGSAEDPHSIAFSVVFTYDSLYFGNAVHICGKNNIANCADDVLTDFDANLH